MVLDALKKRNDSLQKLHDQMKPLHHAIAEASIQLSSHTIGNSKTTLKDISNAIKYEEPYDILEHGAKGNSLKNWSKMFILNNTRVDYIHRYTVMFL